MKILCQQKCIEASPEERDMFSCQPTSSLSQSYHNIKKNGTSVHHSICVHNGNKLFIVHTALPFFVSFVSWAAVLLCHLVVRGRWLTHCGVAALPPALQSTREEPEWCNGSSPAFSQAGVALTCPALSHVWLSTMSCTGCHNLRSFLPNQLKDSGLRLFSVPPHLLLSLKKTQVPSSALLQICSN